MPSRFTDTNKWADGWFIDLNPVEKLLFMYLCDNCDVAGFYEVSLRKMMFDTGCDSEQIKSAMKGLDKCYLKSSDERVIFIKKFLKHQKNLPLNPDNKAHRGIISRLDNFAERFEENLKELINKENPKGLQSPQGIGIGKGNIELYSKNARFLKIFERWLNYKKARREMYKTQDSLDTSFRKLLKYSDYDLTMAELIIDSAIGNNYSGFFELSAKEIEKINQPKTQDTKTKKIDHRSRV